MNVYELSDEYASVVITRYKVASKIQFAVKVVGALVLGLKVDDAVLVTRQFR